MRRVSGFTLIELIVVIAILGILAATALPRFVDLSGDARNASRDGYGASIQSGAAINYAAQLANNAAATTINTCTTAVLGRAIQGGWPGVTVLSVSGTFAAAGITNPTTGSCMIAYSASGGSSATLGYNFFGVSI